MNIKHTAAKLIDYLNKQDEDEAAEFVADLVTEIDEQNAAINKALLVLKTRGNFTKTKETGFLICRDCGYKDEIALFPSTTAGDPACPKCGNDWV